MKCPKCQFENPENSVFCGDCGASLEMNCPNCGSTPPPGFKFCNKCGHDLQKPEETVPVDYEKPQSYTPRFLADKILTTRSSIEGERKLVTVFFADVASYTTLSEKLDPEEVHQIMDGAFKILMDEIHRFEGTINQFTGDGVMALFGAPVAHEDHAQRACYAALSVQDAIQTYGEKVKADCGIEFVMRIGLNSGQVIVGSIGDDLRMDYTAIGDTTNLAARMEELAEPGTVLLSKNTYKLARDYFEVNELGSVQVKGKEEPEEAYELIKPSKIETRIHASAAKGLTKFVGRKNSMAALMEPYEKAKSGSGQVVSIVGEAGVGKSRLLLEFRNRLSQDDHIWLEGRCLHFGGSMAYLPVLDILRSYFSTAEGDREYIITKKIKEKTLELDDKLGGTIAPFQDLLSVKADDEAFANLEPQQKRERIFEALRDLFIRESQNQTVILVFEDLHWIDNTTQEFINYLIDWIGNTRILLIVLYRPEYIHQWGSKSHYSKIGLTQLGLPSSTELVQAILQGGDVLPELRELVLNKAAGNPLFMEEFTQTLLENGSIQKEDGKYILARDTEQIQVPDTIQGIIAARMDRLEDNLKRTMQIASVIGRDFAFRILQTITGMREDLKSCLLNLQGLEFIYEKSLFPELEYIFKHALIQEVAYNSLLQTRRKEIHDNIGAAIENLYANRLEEFYEMLAYHYSKADNPTKAYHYLKLSGQKALSAYSHSEAYGFFKEAIDYLRQMPDTDESKKEQIDVRMLIFKPAIALVFPEGSLEIFQEGEQLAKKIGDQKSLAFFNIAIMWHYNFIGDRTMALKYTEDAFDNAWRIQDLEMICQSAYALSSSYHLTDKMNKIIEIASKVLPMIEKANMEANPFGCMTNPYASILGYYGATLALFGNVQKGISLCEKGLKFSQEINDLPSIAFSECFLGGTYLWKGDAEKCIAHLESSLNHCQEAHFFLFYGLVWGELGYGHMFKGDFDTAIDYIKKGLKLQAGTGRNGLLSLFYLWLAHTLFSSGKLEAALEAIENGLKMAGENNEKIVEGLLMAVKGAVLGKKDPSNYQEAEETLQKGNDLLKNYQIKSFYSLGYLYMGEFYLNSGQQEKAIEYLKKAEKNFKDMEMDYFLNKTQEFLDSL